ncbi:hypothetical protein [Desulfoluna spongiiphila]|uniref:hypothetical protein n=1 Tax=Desulfoluna spongiiphila TaxID=419481 RepID=UPI001255E30A|nr:hypothetical protein [Desulfoluna spongiiphila]VVS94435.1 hypothetical protein DBB_40070 [Desulfoluna spongiiphila]
MVFESLHAGGVALPVPAWIVKGLHLVTLTTHVAVMTLLLGAALIHAAGFFLLDGRGPETPKLPVWMAFTINTGVAPLLFCQALFAHFIYTSSILMAGWWLGAVGVLMTAYYLSYLAVSSDAPRQTRRWAAVSTAFLLLLVSFVFVCNIDLMEKPGQWARYADSPHGWILFSGGADTLFRWFHVVLAALFHALLFSRLLGRAGQLNGRGGIWLGGGLLVLLAASGLSHAAFLPEAVRQGAGRGVLNLYLLAASAGFLGVLLVGGRLKACAIWTLVNLTLMICFREEIRTGFLSPVTTTGPTDYGSFVMFAAALALGGAAFVYMLGLLRKGGEA